MVLVKILGLLDLVAGIVIILLKFQVLNWLGILLSIYLLVKGLIFIKDISSVLDIITAIFLCLASLGNYFSFTWIFSIWLLQKGFFSILSN